MVCLKTVEEVEAIAPYDGGNKYLEKVDHETTKRNTPEGCYLQVMGCDSYSNMLYYLLKTSINTTILF